MRYKNDIKYSYPKYNYPDFTNLKLDKNFCYYLGLLWSDGYVNDNKAIIELNESDFSDIVEYIKNIGEFRYSIRQRKNRKNKISSCSIHSVKSCKWLIDLDYKEKSIKSPNKVLNLVPKDLIPYFYKGYFDGDGCIYIGKNSYQLYFCGSYEQDWEFIEKFLQDLDINYRIIRKEQNQNNRINKSSIVRITKKEDIRKIMNYFPNIGLKRKKIDL